MQRIRSWLRADQCLVKADLKTKIGHALALGVGSVGGAGFIYGSYKLADTGSTMLAKWLLTKRDFFKTSLQSAASVNEQKQFRFVTKSATGSVHDHQLPNSPERGFLTPAFETLCAHRKNFYYSSIGLVFLPPMSALTAVFALSSAYCVALVPTSVYNEYCNFRQKFLVLERGTVVQKPINFCHWTRLHFKCTTIGILGTAATVAMGVGTYIMGSSSWEIVRDIYDSAHQYFDIRREWQSNDYNHEWKSVNQVARALKSYATKHQLSDTSLRVDPVMRRGYSYTSDSVVLDLRSSTAKRTITSKDLWTFDFLERIQRKQTSMKRMLFDSMKIL